MALNISAGNVMKILNNKKNALKFEWELPDANRETLPFKTGCSESAAQFVSLISMLLFHFHVSLLSPSHQNFL